MTQYPPQTPADGSEYGYGRASNQDYYNQQPQYGQYGSPGSHGYSQPPQQSYQNQSYGNEPPRDYAQSYYGSNDQAYQQYPQDRPPQSYGGEYTSQGPHSSHYQQSQYQEQQQPPHYGGAYENNQHQQFPQHPNYAGPANPSYDQQYRGQTYPQNAPQPPHNYLNAPYGQPSHPQYGAPQPGTEEDRGLMGALAGGAAGGFAGHKMNHGILGTLGGAVAGSMLEDKLKKEKKHKKPKKEKKHKRRDSSSSSSSSSSSDSGKSPAPVAAGMAGNWSASSRAARLESEGRVLVAECEDVHGRRHESRIDLNDCLTNTHGRFFWARGGNFRPSARDVRLVDGGRVLEAELGDGQGGWVRNALRLDERIENDDGRLRMI